MSNMTPRMKAIQKIEKRIENLLVQLALPPRKKQDKQVEVEYLAPKKRK